MTTSVGGFSSTYAIGVVWAQYFDVLSGEIEKNLYKICLLLYIQILYRFFSIISLDKTSRYCGLGRQMRRDETRIQHFYMIN